MARNPKPVALPAEPGEPISALVTSALDHDGEPYAPGARIILDADTFAALERAGVVTLADEV